VAWAALRDIGQVRSVNQDSVFALTTTLPRGERDVTVGLFVVADGMGGHAGGEVASRLAIAAVARRVLQDLVLPTLDETASEPVQSMLTAALQDANRAVWEHGQQVGADPGTTCTAALLLGHTLYIAHIGDSRAYVRDRAELRCLTDDHSAVGRLIAIGELTLAAAREHPLRSHLYRTVGQHPEVAVDLVVEPIRGASQLLVCSDGLWSMLDDPQIAAIMAQATDPHAAARALIAAANAAGGEDNIAAVVVDLPTQH
jgi:PPM family protein phosphatase